MIRRYGLHLMTGVEDRIFVKTEALPSIDSALSCSGIEFSLSDGKSDRDCGYPDLQGLLRKCLRFCSNPEQTCMDCMSDITN